ncbi:MAG: hypothetical protein V3S29_06460, partial [bacterium]
FIETLDDGLKGLREEITQLKSEIGSELKLVESRLETRIEALRGDLLKNQNEQYHKFVTVVLAAVPIEVAIIIAVVNWVMG